jgi:hypothetical protein
MAGLVQFEELEDAINIYEFTQDQYDEYLLRSILNELAGVFHKFRLILESVIFEFESHFQTKERSCAGWMQNFC